MRRTGRSAAVALLASAVVVGALAVIHTGTANAIANGTAVPEGQYRFSVKLTMTGIPTPSGGRRNSGCSGALIAPQWVITAGHCFRDFALGRVDRPVADKTIATVGRANVTQAGGYEANVVEVHQARTTDVALAKLDVAIEDIAPLQVGTTPPAERAVVRLTGFGSTRGDNPVPSDQLNTGQFTVKSLSDSLVNVTGLAPAPSPSASPNAFPPSPCQFDSGAPFFSETDPDHPVLVSVESNGPTCPHDQTEHSARTDNLAAWIHSIIDQPAPVAAP